MKFKVGDKVKFLNERGGGIVSKIISPTMVNVMISEGFEIPVMTGDLIVVGEEGRVASMFDEKPGGELRTGVKKEQPSSIPAPVEEEEESRSTPLVNFSFRTRNEKGIYLAVVPHDQRWLVTGDADIYLVNHTGYDVIYSFFLKDEGGYTGIDYDVIPSHHKILVVTAAREEINEWQEGLVQMLFHKDEPEAVYLPASQSFHIKTTRLVGENSYVESEFLEERALLVQVAALASMSRIPGTAVEEKEQREEPATKKAEVQKPGAFIDRYRTGPHEAVVDLHIEELTDDTGKMSPHEILQYQLRHFERCIESAIQANYHKVTFIHGVGNGTLKSALIKRLQEYENLENHSASLAKFGVGAIDVVIRPLK